MILNFRRILSINNGNKFNKLINISKLGVSQFKKPSHLKLQDNHTILINELLAKNEIEFKDFSKLRNKIIECDRYVNDINVDSIIIGCCSKDSNLDAAKLYVNFLKDQGIEINFGTYGKLLRLYFLYSNKYGLNKRNEEEILQM